MADEEQVTSTYLADRERDTKHYLELTLLKPSQEQQARPHVGVLPQQALDEQDTSIEWQQALDEQETSMEWQLMLWTGAA